MESWNGEERRRYISQFCEQHISLTSDMAVIKNSIQNIEKCIIEGVTFRKSIYTALIGISITLLIQMGSFAYLFGQISKQVEVNTKRLAVLEQKGG